MRILFIISTLSHGTGGHLHSLNHISKELSRFHDVKILTLGYGFSKVLAQNPHFLKHFKFNGLNILGLYRCVKKIKKTFSPDIYHFFDHPAYNILRFYFSSRKYKVILTKCGGPNIEWPFANTLILFQQENYDWYRNVEKFLDSNMYLIPNRVHKLSLIDACKPIVKDPAFFNFVRICRIGIVYKKSIQDCINLILYLCKEGLVQSRLYIIGTIEDQSILDEIKNEIKDQPEVISFLTENEYTQEASRMLYLADAVIGTGRGLMEASSLGIPVLTMNADDIYPLLVTEFNFNEVFKTNFSPRNRILNYNSIENLINIKKMIKEKDFYATLSDFSMNCFNKHFNVNKVSEIYTKLYETAKLGPNKYVSDIKIILRSFNEFFLSYKLLKNQAPEDIS